MIITCNTCGKEFKKIPSKVKKRNFCSIVCFTAKITKPCEACGKNVTRVPSQMLNRVFCSIGCSKKYLSEKMTAMNEDLNPERMTMPVRIKLRKARLGKGESKTYTKTFGVHTHRVVAEQMLGRPLKPGEVVHHIDEDKRNNHPLNLMVFASQALHALWHKNEKTDPSKNYE